MWVMFTVDQYLFTQRDPDICENMHEPGGLYAKGIS